MKVWKCSHEACFTQCVLPWHPDHDQPYGCSWNGYSDFQAVDMEPTELLKLFEPSGEYSDFVRICRIPGRAICTSGYNGDCTACLGNEKVKLPE